jgi:hypothetical protein
MLEVVFAAFKLGVILNIFQAYMYSTNKEPARLASSILILTDRKPKILPEFY